MNNVSKPTVKTLVVSLSLLLIISACGGGGGSTKKTTQPVVPVVTTPTTSTQCGQSTITSEQTCTNVDGRAAITYAPSNQSEYAGLAIFLHGAPGTANKVSNLFGATMLADKFNFVSLVPEGNGSNYQWNSSSNSLVTTPDVDYLVNLIDDIQSQYAFAGNKVYIFGYSAGGFMAYKLACQIPERLTAVISLAGQFRGNFDNCSTSTPTAIHHLHSQSDLDVPFNGRDNGDISSVTDTVSFWQQKNGCSIDLETLTQDGVTASSPKTDTEKYAGCVKSVALSKMSLVNHEDNYIADKLLAIYEYLLIE